MVHGSQRVVYDWASSFSTFLFKTFYFHPIIHGVNYKFLKQQWFGDLTILAPISLSSLKKLTYQGVIYMMPVLLHIAFQVHRPSLFTNTISTTVDIIWEVLCVPLKHFMFPLGSPETWFLSSRHLGAAMWLLPADRMWTDLDFFNRPVFLRDLSHALPLSSLLWQTWGSYVKDDGIPGRNAWKSCSPQHHFTTSPQNQMDWGVRRPLIFTALSDWDFCLFWQCRQKLIWYPFRNEKTRILNDKWLTHSYG